MAAEATSTLHVGSVVLNNDLRNPVVLAKEIATLGLATVARVEVGLGAGWLRSDYEQAGIEFDKPAVRVDRLAESLAEPEDAVECGGGDIRRSITQCRPDGFRRLAGATGGLRDTANGVQARALPCDGDPG